MANQTTKLETNDIYDIVYKIVTKKLLETYRKLLETYPKLLETNQKLLTIS